MADDRHDLAVGVQHRDEQEGRNDEIQAVAPAELRKRQGQRDIGSRNDPVERDDANQPVQEEGLRSLGPAEHRLRGINHDET